MAEYINRGAVIEKNHGGVVYIDDIKNIPASDVAPVRHGWWGTHSDRPDSLICSVCKCGFDMWKHDPHNYCPNCGAKMDGERKDEANEP